MEDSSSYPEVLVEDLQSHARALAVELMAAGVVYDTLIRKEGERILSDAWEVPSGSLPESKPLVLGPEGLYTNEGPRIPGRQVRLIDEREVAPKGTEISIRHRLYAMERKHDIFNKLNEQSAEGDT